MFTGSELSGSVYVSESVDSAMLQAPMFFTQVHGNIKYQADSMKLLIKGETIVDKRLESIPLVSPSRAWNGKNNSIKAASAVSCQYKKPVVVISLNVKTNSAKMAAKVEDGWNLVSKNKRSKK